MSFRFRPQDFTANNTTEWVDVHDAAEMANELLRAHLKTLPKVRGRDAGVGGYTNYIMEQQPDEDENTHTALLWDVQLIDTKKSFKDIASSISEQLKKPLTQKQIDKINAVLEGSEDEA